jgi:hypothetical protein
MRSLEVCHSGDEWYVTLEGTFVVGFIGTEAEHCAREQLSQLSRMLDLHRDPCATRCGSVAGSGGRPDPSVDA